MPTKMTQEFKSKAIQEITNAGMPVSIDYMANRLKIGWGTARAILMELALEQRLEAMKTTKSWVFWVKDGRVKQP